MNQSYGTVSVIGLGYIGLPTAAVLASRGVEVVGVDVNATAVNEINEGRAHFFEPELDAMVRGTVQEGRLRAVLQPEPADAFIIAVPTPLTADRAPDLSYIEAAGVSIAPVLKAGDLIILESTSPVGTLERLAATLAAARPDFAFPADGSDASDILMAYCPERIIPGRMMTELVENDRIVGGLTKAATAAASALYDTFVRGKIVPTDARTAEMVKLTENAYRDVNIAFANELSMVCDGLDIDPWEVIDLANHHPRVNILQPGPGVGGHCIAVDPWFIVHSASETAPLMRTAREVNDRKPDFVVEKIMALASSGDRIACLGLAYKADTDDLRESPAIEIVEALCRKHDGEIMLVEPNIAQLPPRLSLPNAKLVVMDEAMNNADVLALLVDHREFRSIAPEVIWSKKSIDTRGLWRSYSRQRRANE
jgi:UDP-N-acetyl-D-mannosaminuronic acid dehydrogenase